MKGINTMIHTRTEYKPKVTTKPITMDFKDSQATISNKSNLRI